MSQRAEERFVFRLYVNGFTVASTRIILAVKQLCEDHLAGRYALNVIDVGQQPQLAASEQIVTVPLLVRKRPLPEVRLRRNLTRQGYLMRQLGLPCEQP